MYDKELSLQEIQQEMVEIVLKIEEICDYLNIRYSLAYGSLIGAIRHNGFIPWDDDLDIWMSKKDVDIFSKYCDEHSEEIKPFKLCKRDNVKNYTYNIPRFTNLDYQYVNTDKYQSMFDIGIFVDIYPIEGYGNTVGEAKKVSQKCKRLNDLYSIYINPCSRKNMINTFIKKMISSYLHFRYKDTYYLRQDEKFQNILKPYQNINCKYVGCPRWADKNPVLHERKNVFDNDGKLNVTRHIFEDKEFNILTNYDVILKTSYGDYMKLPPEDKRCPYHEYKIFRRK